jgi:hypothetical protein
MSDSLREIGWVLVHKQTGELPYDPKIYKSEKGALTALKYWPGFPGEPKPIYIEANQESDG